MDIKKRLESVIDTLADMHDSKTCKNYPEEKCLACICQEDIQDIIDYITQHPLKRPIIAGRCVKYRRTK